MLRHARIKSMEMLKIAIACAEDTEAPWPARVNAALAVLDRAWGKPKEHVQVDGDGIATLRIQFVDARDEQNGTVITGAACATDAETFQIALNGHGEEAASAPLQQEEEP